MSDPATARAWGWVAHLRDGGTTPWCDWAGAGEPTGTSVPGAQQLELLRRLNAVGPPSPSLSSRVLAAEPSRRARPALPLLGLPTPATYGPRPVDPAALPVGDLVDLAAAVLAGALATQRPPSPPTGVARPWAPRYHLHGDPEMTRWVGRHLTAHGRPPATHGGRALVLGTDAGRMLVDAWTHRALTGGVVRWPEWWRRRAGRDRFPWPVDLEGAVEAGYRRPGVRGVHVVTDPALAPRLVGLRRPLPPSEPLAATAVDVGRRVVRALRPLVSPPTRRALSSEVLRPRLAGVPGPPLVVPAEHREWVREEARRLISRFRSDPDRYPVHGDLELLLPVDRPGAEVVRPRDSLTVALELLLADADPPSAEEAP